MKLTSLTTALALCITASAQSEGFSQLLSGIPSCAQQCAIQAGTASPCVTDLTVACLCKNMPSIQSDLSSCLAKSTCTEEEIAQVAGLGGSICPAPTPSPTAIVDPPEAFSSSTSISRTAIVDPPGCCGGSPTTEVTSTTVVKVTSCPPSSTISASPTKSANGTVVYTTKPPAPTFTGGASRVATMYGGIALMAAVAWML